MVADTRPLTQKSPDWPLTAKSCTNREILVFDFAAMLIECFKYTPISNMCQWMSFPQTFLYQFVNTFGDNYILFFLEDIL